MSLTVANGADMSATMEQMLDSQLTECRFSGNTEERLSGTVFGKTRHS